MEVSERKNSRIIDGTALCFSLALLAASAAGAVYTGTGNTLFADFLRILTSPGPLITDYFGVGSLPAAFSDAVSLAQKSIASNQVTISTGRSAPLNSEGFVPMMASYCA